jgi:hypothetical protein
MSEATHNDNFKPTKSNGVSGRDISQFLTEPYCIQRGGFDDVQELISAIENHLFSNDTFEKYGLVEFLNE